MATAFEILNAVNVNGHTEKKSTGKDRSGKPIELTYLSWPWAWAEVVKRYPDASYEIVKNPQGLPYFYDPLSGIMVYTRVTVEGVTREMWLPVMDGANNAMRFEPYEIQTKWGTKPVNAATMFDVNKTVMRCLVKNLAMFGLGLYIYAGEDLPEGEPEPDSNKPVQQTTVAQMTPEEAKKQNRLSQISDVMQSLQMTQEKFNSAWAAVVQAGMVPKAHWKNLSDDDFANLLNAIVANFQPEEGAA